MAGDTHLFVALSATAFGEVTLGLRIARQLLAAGDQAVFLGPGASRVLFEGTGVEHVPVEAALWSGVEAEVRRLLRAHRARSLAVIDATAVLLGLQEVGEDGHFLVRLDLPVVALDCWNLPEAGLRWDYGPDAMAIPEVALEIERRMMPVPPCRPTAGPGVFDALPEERPVPEADAARERATLGLGAGDKLVLLAGSRFWEPGVQVWSHHKRLALHVPELVTGALAALPPQVKLVHVAPAAWPEGPLGDRYRWIGQVPPDRFARLLAASDLLLSLNTSGTTTVAAVARGTPVVLGMNSYEGRTADEVLARMGRPPDDPLRPWLEKACPLFPFRLFPLGLFGLLAPVLAGNPYLETVRSVEVLEVASCAAACRELLFDAGARAALRRRQEEYCRTVRALPAAGDVYRARI